MIGAIIGDIVGSVYEFDNIKTKDFPFFSPDCEPTDDSVMSLAVAKSILEAEDLEALAGITVANMVWLGNRYPHAGYGGRFYQWLKKGKYTPHPGPYNSFGNGSAMRASPCGFAAKTLEDALSMARITAEVTHNHPEGVKGAQATAAAVYLAKTGAGMDEIKAYITAHFYSIDFTLESPYPMRTPSATPFPSAATATPSRASPAASRKRTGACRTASAGRPCSFWTPPRKACWTPLKPSTPLPR